MMQHFTLKKTFAIALLVTACLPVIAAGFIFQSFFSDTLKKEITERNFFVAKTMASEVNGFFKYHRVAVELMSSQISTHELLSHEHLDMFLKIMIRHYPLFNNIRILDKQARIINLAPFRDDFIGLDMSGHPFIRKAMTGGQTVWSDVRLSTRTGNPVVSMAVPFRLGTIVVNIDLAFLKEIAGKELIGGRAYAAISDRTGTTIAHPNQSFVKERLNVRNLVIIQKGLMGKQGTFPYHFRGVPKIGSVVHISETGWLLFIFQTQKRAFSAVQKFKAFLWTSTLLICLAVLFVSLYFLKKAISPISRLVTMTKNIAGGNYQVDDLPATYPEIDQLAQNFKSMAKAVSIREHQLKQSRERLRQSEKELTNIMNSVSDLIYTQDLDGKFLSVNKAITSLLGYRPEEIIGRKASELMAPEIRHLFISKYLSVLKQKGIHKGISTYLTKYNHRVYLEHLSTLVTPNEAKPFISGIARDVTKRLKAEKAVMEREQRIQAILEAVPNPLVVYDMNGFPQYLNPAFTTVFGWQLDELKGVKIPFVPYDQQERTAAAINELYRNKGISTFETRRLTKDGHILDILINATIILDNNENPSGMVVSLTDLTEKKRMEASLRHAQKMEAIGTLAGGIAHDFNNLLMAIQGSISLVMMDLKPDNPLYYQLQSVEKYACQGAKLTRQLLGFAKGGKYEVKPLNLNEVIKSHNQTFGRARKDIRIHEEYEKNLWAVVADQGQMEQVLMNLYINSADAMPYGGNIFVYTKNILMEYISGSSSDEPAGRYVRISVIDTGSGMDRKVCERIFEPFFTTKDMGRGTGLGLATVYGIVKNHHGYIEVESEKGKGTSFHIFLPASDEQVLAGNKKQNKQKKALKGEGCILLVDDENMILDVGEQMLKRIGYRVITARNGKEAIKLYKIHKDEIDLIILDMIMPEMSGQEAFEHFRKFNPEVRIMLSSGYSIEGQAQDILEKGCNGFIQKPFSLEELNKKINKILEDNGIKT